MISETLVNNGLVLLGCGKMGSAMLQGWLNAGLPTTSAHVIDPYPSNWVQGLAAKGMYLNEDLPKNPAVCIIAVKPQMMQEALPALKAMGGDTVFLSIAAGTSISTFEDSFGAIAKIVRAMPNTPAAIGKGITALIGNAQVTENDLSLCEELLAAVGQTVRLENESQMDAVTAVSGSGPAYVFHLIETLAAAGVEQGLPESMAMNLAKATVSGAGQLAADADETPEQLRINVTSPAGTTEAALKVLMDSETGFPNVLRRGVKAAADRSKELGKK